MPLYEHQNGLTLPVGIRLLWSIFVSKLSENTETAEGWWNENWPQCVHALFLFDFTCRGRLECKQAGFEISPVVTLALGHVLAPSLQTCFQMFTYSHCYFHISFSFKKKTLFEPLQLMVHVPVIFQCPVLKSFFKPWKILTNY